MKYFLLTLICLYSSAPVFSTEGPNTTRINAINTEIQELQQELHSERIRALNEEVRAQPHMIDDWKGFADDIERVEDNENHILAIKKHIEKLEQEKRELDTVKSSEK